MIEEYENGGPTGGVSGGAWRTFGPVAGKPPAPPTPSPAPAPAPGAGQHGQGNTPNDTLAFTALTQLLASLGSGNVGSGGAAPIISLPPPAGDTGGASRVGGLLVVAALGVGGLFLYRRMTRGS